MRKLLSYVVLILIAVGSFVCLFNTFYGKGYSNKIVNIVFTTDINYKDYLKTTLRSAIANKNKDSVYNINILCVDLTESERKKFKKFTSKNVRINLIPVTLKSIEHVGNYKISYKITRADLFKFFMPELFPDLDKILYIDADTAIVGDLTKLYNTYLGNKFIGAVYKCTKEKKNDHLYDKFYYMRKFRRYNCGVILFNLKQWRENDITNKLIDEKNKGTERRLMTQNVFNRVITPDKVRRLSPRNNIFTQWESPRFKSYHFWLSFFPYCITGCSFDSLVKTGTIIHYVDYNKPWDYKDRGVSQYWLQYVKEEDYK